MACLVPACRHLLYAAICLLCLFSLSPCVLFSGWQLCRLVLVIPGFTWFSVHSISFRLEKLPPLRSYQSFLYGSFCYLFMSLYPVSGGISESFEVLQEVIDKYMRFGLDDISVSSCYQRLLVCSMRGRCSVFRFANMHLYHFGFNFLVNQVQFVSCYFFLTLLCTHWTIWRVVNSSVDEHSSHPAAMKIFKSSSSIEAL